MESGFTTAVYVTASILFILALGGLSNQETARRGNVYGIVDWEHNKTGRGGAKVKLKLRDVRAGHTIQHTLPRVGKQWQQGDGREQQGDGDRQFPQQGRLAHTPCEEDDQDRGDETNRRDLAASLHHETQHGRLINGIGDRNKFASLIVRRHVQIHADRKPRTATLRFCGLGRF